MSLHVLGLVVTMRSREASGGGRFVFSKSKPLPSPPPRVNKNSILIQGGKKGFRSVKRLGSACLIGQESGKLACLEVSPPPSSGRTSYPD